MNENTVSTRSAQACEKAIQLAPDKLHRDVCTALLKLADAQFATPDFHSLANYAWLLAHSARPKTEAELRSLLNEVHMLRDDTNRNTTADAIVVRSAAHHALDTVNQYIDHVRIETLKGAP